MVQVKYRRKIPNTSKILIKKDVVNLLIDFLKQHFFVVGNNLSLGNLHSITPLFN